MATVNASSTFTSNMGIVPDHDIFLHSSSSKFQRKTHECEQWEFVDFISVESLFDSNTFSMLAAYLWHNVDGVAMNTIVKQYKSGGAQRVDFNGKTYIETRGEIYVEQTKTS